MPRDVTHAPPLGRDEENWPGEDPEEGEVENPSNPGDARVVDPVRAVDVDVFVRERERNVDVSTVVRRTDELSQAIGQVLFIQSLDRTGESEHFEGRFGAAEVPAPVHEIGRDCLIVDFDVLLEPRSAYFTPRSAVDFAGVSCHGLLPHDFVRGRGEEGLQAEDEIEIVYSVLGLLTVVFTRFFMPSADTDRRPRGNQTLDFSNVRVQVFRVHEFLVHADGRRAADRDARRKAAAATEEVHSRVGFVNGLILVSICVGIRLQKCGFGVHTIVVRRQIWQIIVVIITSRRVHRNAVWIVTIGLPRVGPLLLVICPYFYDFEEQKEEEKDRIKNAKEKTDLLDVYSKLNLLVLRILDAHRVAPLIALSLASATALGHSLEFCATYRNTRCQGRAQISWHVTDDDNVQHVMRTFVMMDASQKSGWKVCLRRSMNGREAGVGSTAYFKLIAVPCMHWLCLAAMAASRDLNELQIRFPRAVKPTGGRVSLLAWLIHLQARRTSLPN